MTPVAAKILARVGSVRVGSAVSGNPALQSRGPESLTLKRCGDWGAANGGSRDGGFKHI